MVDLKKYTFNIGIILTTIISWFFMLQVLSQEQPVLEWANEFHISGVNNGLGVLDHAVDQDDNSYIIGRFSGTFDFDPSANEAVFSTFPGEIDLFVAKYNSEGDYLWCFTLRDNGYDLKIVLDNQSNVYIAGVFNSTLDFDPSANTFELTSIASTDLFLTKYDSEGNFIWAKAMEGTGSVGLDDLEIDRSNEKIYISGYFTEATDFDPGSDVDEYTVNPGEIFDVFIAKYDFNGNYEWTNQISNGQVQAYHFTQLGVDEEMEEVYLTGKFIDTVQFDPDSLASPTISYSDYNSNSRDIFIVKYTSQGAFMWVDRLYGEFPQTINELKIINGSLYCVGQVSGELYFSNVLTSEIITANVYAVNPFILKLDILGNLDHYIEMKGIDGWGSAVDLSISNDSSINVVGVFNRTMNFSTDSASNEVFADSSYARVFIAKYDDQLNLNYVNVLKGTGSNHEALGISNYEGSNSFSITGNFLTSIDLNPSEDDEYLLENNDINRKWFLAKYKESSVSLEEEHFNEVEINLYPNPTHESHTLELTGFGNKEVWIELFDIQGRKINTIHDDKVSNKHNFQVDVSTLNAGVYLYRVISNHQRKTIRFIKQ